MTFRLTAINLKTFKAKLMDYLDTFSQFAAGITYEALGSDIHEQVGWILADTVGAMVAGSAEPELRALAARQAPGASAALV